MEDVFDTALMKASPAARLAGGRGMVLLIQARATTYPLYTDGTWKPISLLEGHKLLCHFFIDGNGKE